MNDWEALRAAEKAAEIAAQIKLDALTVEVARELTNLGHACKVDVARSENNPDARFLAFKGFNVRAMPVTYGANKGRISWNGYAVSRKSPGDSYHNRPKMNDTSSAPDAPASRIAKQIVSKIIAPSVEPIAKYNATCDEWDARAAALPAQIAIVNKMGFECKAAASETEAGFYISRKGASGSARINADGAVYLDRLSLDAETGRCVLEFLAARAKG